MVYTYDLHTHAMADMWKLGENFGELLLFHHCGILGSNSGCQAYTASTFIH